MGLAPLGSGRCAGDASFPAGSHFTPRALSYSGFTAFFDHRFIERLTDVSGIFDNEDLVRRHFLVHLY